MIRRDSGNRSARGIRRLAVPPFVDVSRALVDSRGEAVRLLRSFASSTPRPGFRLFHYSRPHPFVHVLRVRAHRTFRRVFAGCALILLGVGSLLKGQGLITGQDLWLIAPALVALSGVVRLVALPGVASVMHAALRFAIAAYLVVVIEHTAAGHSRPRGPCC